MATQEAIIRQLNAAIKDGDEALVKMRLAVRRVDEAKWAASFGNAIQAATTLAEAQVGLGQSVELLAASEGDWDTVEPEPGQWVNTVDASGLVHTSIYRGFQGSAETPRLSREFDILAGHRLVSFRVDGVVEELGELINRQTLIQVTQVGGGSDWTSRLGNVVVADGDHVALNTDETSPRVTPGSWQGEKVSFEWVVENYGINAEESPIALMEYREALSADVVVYSVAIRPGVKRIGFGTGDNRPGEPRSTHKWRSFTVIRTFEAIP